MCGGTALSGKKRTTNKSDFGLWTWIHVSAYNRLWDSDFIIWLIIMGQNQACDIYII